MKKNKFSKKRSRDENKNSPFEDRKRFCPFSQKNSPKIDYKDVRLLSRYVSEKGKITPSRITNVSRQKQKELSKAIKRARFLSLMSFTNKNFYN
ncbi:MAG: 30S ribosomal protein S18 [Pelagibacteraceae bacterium]|nr:30S ribosomal protein S18 [Pelagibacteraceae bacterium]|tara:strand:+ start:18578 stop:18859 length:282 start_codon:yes stop_codon:yes gene_type:complete